MKACGTCANPATHRLRSGHFLCDPCAARVTAALHRRHTATLPVPLTQPDLFGVAS